jgi:hypothetical protein
MEGGELIGELVKVLGGAGVGVAIMYLWIKHLLKENGELKVLLKDSQDARVEELKNILPLLTSASEGLQVVISDNNQRDTTLVKNIISHIELAVKNLGNKCNYNKNGN